MEPIHLLKEDRHYENHMYCGVVDHWFEGAEVFSEKVYRAVSNGVLWTEETNRATCADCNANFAKEHNATS